MRIARAVATNYTAALTYRHEEARDPIPALQTEHSSSSADLRARACLGSAPMGSDVRSAVNARSSCLAGKQAALSGPSRVH